MPHAGLLGLLTVLGPVSMDLYLPGLPDVSQSLGLARGAASATLFACLAGLAVGQVLWGQVIDRLGTRGPLLFGIALWVASSAGCALATAGAELIVLRAVEGIAGGCGMTVARALLAQRLAGHLLAAALARIALVTNVCAVSAPLAGGALLGAVGWRGLFLVLAAGGCVVALLAAVAFRERAGEVGPRPYQAADPRARDLLIPLRSPRYVRGAAVAVVSFAQVVLYVSIAPAMLRGHYGLGGAAFGAVFAVTVAALVLGTRMAPLLLRSRLRQDPLVAACLAAAAAATAEGAAAAVDAWPPLAVLTVLLALGNATAGVLISLGATESLSATTAGVGAAAGLLGGLQFGGGAALATLVTTAGVRNLGGYGLAGALMCLLSAAVATGVQAGGAMRRGRRHARPGMWQHDGAGQPRARARAARRGPRRRAYGEKRRNRFHRAR